MPTSNEFADHIHDLVKDAGNIRHKKMFGEFALYCDEKVVALICDNQLFIKPTVEGRAYIDSEEIPFSLGKPYPGAKDYFRMDTEDSEYLSELVHITADALPLLKKKKKKK